MIDIQTAQYLSLSLLSISVHSFLTPQNRYTHTYIYIYILYFYTHMVYIYIYICVCVCVFTCGQMRATISSIPTVLHTAQSFHAGDPVRSLPQTGPQGRAAPGSSFLRSSWSRPGRRPWDLASRALGNHWFMKKGNHPLLWQNYSGEL